MRQILEFGFSALVSGLIAWRLPLWLRQLGILDRPNNRSSHDSPTPRGGGIAIIMAICVSTFAFQLVSQSLFVEIFLLITCILATVSLIDDIHPLGPSIRFGIHAASAVAVLSLLANEPYPFASTSPGRGAIVIVGFGVSFIWIAGYTNAFNFMDGINGIASGQAVFTGIGTALVAGLASGVWNSVHVMLSVIVAGAAAGFAPHNFPRARMFMGDVGSAPLGFILAVLVLWTARETGYWLLVPLALLHTNFILDTSITLLRRCARGERWYEPHREHFYQKLIRAGKSHAFVTGTEMILQIATVIFVVSYLYMGAPVRVVFIVAVCGIWAGFFGFCELALQKSEAVSVRAFNLQIPIR